MLLNELEDPKLKELASKLPLSCLKAKQTVTPGSIWKLLDCGRSGQHHTSCSIPTREHKVPLYLQYSANESGLKSEVEEICYVLE